ncbi:MAG TPA: DUF1800 domain-containing protein [Bacteroidetes bacterium]|nr:DUF1800 domain-containing protein [Bacteroidota bacterium]
MAKQLDRRSFLRFGRLSERGSANNLQLPKPPTATVLSSLDPYNGPWGTEQVAHLLRRTMFGAKNTDVEFFKNKTPTQAVNILLADFDMPDPPINDYGDPNLAGAVTWVYMPYNQEQESARLLSLKAWWIGNMLQQKRSLREKMVLFWHNHLPVQFEIVQRGVFAYGYLNTIYEHAFGNFKTLVKAITLDPAMLIYLNGVLNSAGAPDENYARELQELFCLGKGPNSNYTEEDVKAAARVLTGWKTNWFEPETFFAPEKHDTGDKQFSAFYNNAVIEGKEGADGALELDELLDLIFENGETAKFICRKIYTFFVYQNIDEEVEMTIIEPLAQLLRDSGYEIKPVLETLLKSEHFFDPWYRGAMLKSPLDQVVGLAREMHLPLGEVLNFKEVFEIRQNLLSYLPNMLQDPGDPPDVSGWPAWFQAPVFYKWWVTVSTLPKRAAHTDLLLQSGYASANHLVGIDVVKYTETLENAPFPTELVEEVLGLFYGIEVPEEVKMQFKSVLLSGQAQDYYWTNAWNDYLGSPEDPATYSVVQTRLQAFYQAVLQLEEYQLL